MEFLRELLHELHIDPTVILVNIVGFLILLAVMRRFFFGPMGQFLAARRQDVAETIEGAEATQRQAEDELTGIRDRQDEMMAEARQDADQTRHQAQHQANELVEESRQEALERRLRAEAQIQQQQAQAVAEVRDQAAQLSVQFAERVLRDGLREEPQQELLEAAIRDVEEIAQREPQ